MLNWRAMYAFLQKAIRAENCNHFQPVCLANCMHRGLCCLWLMAGETGAEGGAADAGCVCVHHAVNSSLRPISLIQTLHCQASIFIIQRCCIKLLCLKCWVTNVHLDTSYWKLNVLNVIKCSGWPVMCSLVSINLQYPLNTVSFVIAF